MWQKYAEMPALMYVSCFPSEWRTESSGGAQGVHVEEIARASNIDPSKLGKSNTIILLDTFIVDARCSPDPSPSCDESYLCGDRARRLREQPHLVYFGHGQLGGNADL